MILSLLGYLALTAMMTADLLAYEHVIAALS